MDFLIFLFHFRKKKFDHHFTHAIMTPTARQIRQISFTPDLPYSKKLALDTLKYFGSVKVFLIFSRPFWAEPNKIKAINYNSTTEKNGGSGVSDDLLRVVSSIAVWGSPIMTSHSTGVTLSISKY